jgi:hypothetical protein
MPHKKDPSIILFEAIFSSLRIIEKIGDTIYSDENASKETKKEVDLLIIKLNDIFTSAIKELENSK